MNFILMHQSIVEHDAIGRDIVEMYKLLADRHRCYLFADYLIGMEGRNRLDRDAIWTLLLDPSTVIIYHHSNFWEEGEAILSRANGPIVFKYHNITPPRCFASYSDCWRACAMGREQTLRFFYKFPDAYWLTDSVFNMAELGLDIRDRMVVLPPFPTMAHGNAVLPDGPRLRHLIESRDLNILFSGRFVPNKGHKLMVQVVAEYVRRYGRAIRLFIVGKLDPVFSPYYDRIQAAIAEACVDDCICYLGSISDTELLAYYLGCDAYLSCSDHEGFCVPVAEAQYCRLPVIAKARGAVSETVGPGGLLFGDDPAPYAEALYGIRTDDGIRRTLIQAGSANYEFRFSYHLLAQSFRDEIRKATGAIL
jgi:glycosyltransferase involved in cell wall biosynthesis